MKRSNNSAFAEAQCYFSGSVIITFDIKAVIYYRWLCANVINLCTGVSHQFWLWLLWKKQITVHRTSFIILVEMQPTQIIGSSVWWRLINFGPVKWFTPTTYRWSTRRVGLQCHFCIILALSGSAFGRLADFIVLNYLGGILCTVFDLSKNSMFYIKGYLWLISGSFLFLTSKRFNLVLKK